MQLPAIRPPAASVPRRAATFAAAIERRHVTTLPEVDVAARHEEDPSIRWPSPGTLFASATVERRALAAGESPGARRSVVAPGPGALRSVLRHSTESNASGVQAVRTEAPSRSTTAVSARTTDPSITAGRPEVRPPTAALIAGSIRRDEDLADRRGIASDGLATVRTTIGRTRAPSRDHVAEQFLTELSRGDRRRPQPLPAPYHPMAEAITGHHRVLISTDDASRRALRAVNKVAATTGDVIHLPAPPTTGRQHTELMAHELTHVAHPSPAPRFFADDHRGPEERRADEMARVIARSPLAPTASIGRRMVSTSTAPRDASVDTSIGGVIRRSPASRRASSGAIGASVSAAALAEQIISGVAPSSSSSSTIRRFDNMPPLPPIPPPTHATSSPPIAPPIDTSPGSKAFWEQVDSTEDSAEWFQRQLHANFDRIVRLLEHHMIGELERRGGRSWKGY